MRFIEPLLRLWSVADRSTEFSMKAASHMPIPVAPLLHSVIGLQGRAVRSSHENNSYRKYCRQDLSAITAARHGLYVLRAGKRKGRGKTPRPTDCWEL